MELMVAENQDITVVSGLVRFDQYETYKKQALDVAEYVKSIKVNDENVKDAKKLLAKVNKSIKSLEDRRIEIKKEMLIPYQEFETQIKEIVGIVKEADEIVRGQVKVLEEIERDIKREKLEEIWDVRTEMYDFGFVMFQEFIEPRHLNKTVTISTVEAEMVEFLERVQKDLGVIEHLPNKNDVLLEYMDCLDLTVALALTQAADVKKREVEKIYKDDVKEEYAFKVFSEKDMQLVELLLQQNKIEYKTI